MTQRNSNADQLITTIISGIEDVKGKEIILLDLREIENTVCDYFIICEGTSNTQVNAIVSSIQKQVSKTFWIRKELQKHRYVYILAGKKHKKNILKTLKHETLPYPKSRDTDESDIITLEPLK